MIFALEHVSLAYARAHIEEPLAQVERCEIRILIISRDGEENLTEQERREVFRQALAPPQVPAT